MENKRVAQVSSQDFSAEYKEHRVELKRQRFSRPKVCDSSFWSNENIKKLIAAIKLYPAIWQTESEGFKSRAQREAAWQKVAECFDEEIIDCNQLVAKWQNLRTQYRSVRAAVKKYMTQQTGKKPAWRFYSQMLFIDNIEANENNDADKTDLESIPYRIPASSEGTADVKVKWDQNRKVIDSAFWSDDNVLKLINAIKKRKSIWNFSDENYKHRAIRESDWRAIDEEFNNKIPVNQLAAKWQNLRTSYRSTKNSAKKLKDGHGLLRPPNWKYYTYMTFLDAGEEVEKCKIENMDDIEELEDFDSIMASEEYAPTTGNGEAFVQNNFDNSSIKEECIVENAGCTNDPLQKIEPDNIDIFGNFFVSELRKIKNQNYLEATQRRILQFLWQCIDEEPITPND